MQSVVIQVGSNSSFTRGIKLAAMGVKMTLRARQIEIDRVYSNIDFEQFLGDKRHLELMDGKLIEKMPIGDEHTRIARRLEAAIILHDPDDTFGYSWRASTFDLGPGYVLESDLAYIVAARVPAVVKGYI